MISGDPVIELRGVTRTFRMGDETVMALDGIDLVIHPGEMVAIVGPSGSGKSTLMNILGCLDTPSAGAYRLDGRDVGSLDDDDLAGVRNRFLGFVFQSYNLLPRLSALQNVELPLQYSGWMSGRVRREAALGALDRVGLAHRSAHRPPELSGGEQQRVGIARALVKDPSMLLADEPTGNLDSRSSEAIIGTLQELNRRDGTTLIIVTHESDIASAAKRIVSLRDGAIEEDRRIDQRVVDFDAMVATGAAP